MEGRDDGARLKEQGRTRPRPRSVGHGRMSVSGLWRDRWCPVPCGVALVALLWSAAAAASPCAGVDRRLSEMARPALEGAVAAEMDLPRVQLLQSYRYAGWRILYVATFRTDETFLFYRRDPPRGRSLTRWGGAAQVDEEPEIRRWVRTNVPGIPVRLAACFAWHVTKDRDL
jgi:hypothetical protein